MGFGDFFNRYEESNNVGFLPLFPEDDKETYYTNTINQAVAYTKKIDPPTITSTLLDINKKLSFNGLDALGGTSESPLSIQIIDPDTVLPVVQGIDSSATEVTDTTMGGGASLFGLPSYVYYNNSLNYGPGIVCGDNIYWDIGGVYQTDINFTIVDDNGTINWNVDYVDLSGNPSGSQSGSMSRDTQFWMVYYDSSDAFDCNGTPTFTRFLGIDDASMPAGEDTDVFVMTVKYKVAGVVNNDKYLKALNARMGLPNRELPKDCEDQDLTPEELADCLEYKTKDELLADPDLRSQILTYAVYYEEPYIDVIDALLANGIFYIEVEGVDGGPHTTIDYHPSTLGLASQYVDPLTGYACFVDGAPVLLNPTQEEIDAGAKQMRGRYIIPLDYIQNELTLREKHDMVENGLCWLMHNQKRTKKKWYQTGFFKILVWVVAFVMAIYGQPMMLIGLVGSTIATGLLGQKAGIVFGILMAVWTLGSSLMSSAYTIGINTFSMVANLANQVSRLYFAYALESIKDEAKQLMTEQEATEDAIDDIRKEALYIPFSDVVDSIYYTMYDLLYNQTYDQMSMYNQLTTVSTVRNYKKV